MNSILLGHAPRAVSPASRFPAPAGSRRTTPASSESRRHGTSSGNSVRLSLPTARLINRNSLIRFVDDAPFGIGQGGNQRWHIGHVARLGQHLHGRQPRPGRAGSYQAPQPRQMGGTRRFIFLRQLANEVLRVGR